MRHPCSKCSQRPHHSIGTAAANSLLPEHTQYNSAPRRLQTHLRRDQYVSSRLLLSNSTPGTHYGDTRPQCPNSTTPPPHSLIIGHTRKCATTCDAGTSPPCHCAGTALQVRSQGAPGPTCPRGNHDPGAPAHHKKLHAIGGRLTWPKQAPNPSDRNTASPY